MDPDRLKALLQAVEARQTSVDEAMRELREAPLHAAGFAAMGFAHADTHRHLRTGFPEVVLGQGKTPEQIAAILIELRRGGSTVMASRVSAEAAAIVVAAVPEARYLPVPRAVVVGPMPAQDRGRGLIAVLSAGTAELAGNRVERIFDVGVAGIHRLMVYRETLETAEVIVVAAGMEGALPSVVGGLFARPTIAVPTSVGYGASLGGMAALLSM